MAEPDDAHAGANPRSARRASPVAAARPRAPRRPAEPASGRRHGRRRRGGRHRRRRRARPGAHRGHRAARRPGRPGPRRPAAGLRRLRAAPRATRPARTPTPRSRSASRRCAPTRSAPSLDRTPISDVRRLDRRHARPPRRCCASRPATAPRIAGAQSQVVEARDFVGFAAAACAEPSGSIWLAGGSMAVGRTSILTLTNPTAVGALVTLTILGEKGAVEAPGHERHRRAGRLAAGALARRLRARARLAGRPRRGARRAGHRLPAAVDRARSRRGRRGPGGCRPRPRDRPHLPRGAHLRFGRARTAPSRWTTGATSPRSSAS